MQELFVYMTVTVRPSVYQSVCISVPVYHCLPVCVCLCLWLRLLRNVPCFRWPLCCHETFRSSDLCQTNDSIHRQLDRRELAHSHPTLRTDHHQHLSLR